MSIYVTTKVIELSLMVKFCDPNRAAHDQQCGMMWMTTRCRTQTSAESRASGTNADDRETKRVSTDDVLTVGIACSGIWAGSLMIMGPMHEEMSFKIDV